MHTKPRLLTLLLSRYHYPVVTIISQLAAHSPFSSLCTVCIHLLFTITIILLFPRVTKIVEILIEPFVKVLYIRLIQCKCMLKELCLWYWLLMTRARVSFRQHYPQYPLHDNKAPGAPQSPVYYLNPASQSLRYNHNGYDMADKYHTLHLSAPKLDQG